MTSQSIAELERLERARGDALVAGDYPAVAALLADDLVHIHANGLCEGKAAYLESMSTKLEFLAVSRADLTIREYESTAVMTGLLEQTVRVKGPGVTVTITALVTQVWRREDGGWRLCSFQATKVE